MTSPRDQPLSERLSASEGMLWDTKSKHESDMHYMEYKVEALESSLRRLWVAFADLEEALDANRILDMESYDTTQIIT